MVRGGHCCFLHVSTSALATKKWVWLINAKIIVLIGCIFKEKEKSQFAAMSGHRAAGSGGKTNYGKDLFSIQLEASYYMCNLLHFL